MAEEYGKWISVKERVPTLPGEYLLFGHFASGRADDWWMGVHFMEVGDPDWKEPSHWMRLPEPPLPDPPKV